jgi:hypothetical protein
LVLLTRWWKCRGTYRLKWHVKSLLCWLNNNVHTAFVYTGI